MIGKAVLKVIGWVLWAVVSIASAIGSFVGWSVPMVGRYLQDTFGNDIGWLVIFGVGLLVGFGLLPASRWLWEKAKQAFWRFVVALPKALWCWLREKAKQALLSLFNTAWLWKVLRRKDKKASSGREKTEPAGQKTSQRTEKKEPGKIKRALKQVKSLPEKAKGAGQKAGRGVRRVWAWVFQKKASDP